MRVGAVIGLKAGVKVDGDRFEAGRPAGESGGNKRDAEQRNEGDRDQEGLKQQADGGRQTATSRRNEPR